MLHVPSRMRCLLSCSWAPAWLLGLSESLVSFSPWLEMKATGSSLGSALKGSCVSLPCSAGSLSAGSGCPHLARALWQGPPAARKQPLLLRWENKGSFPGLQPGSLTVLFPHAGGAPPRAGCGLCSASLPSWVCQSEDPVHFPLFSGLFQGLCCSA